MADLDDIRALATIDTRHARLRRWQQAALDGHDYYIHRLLTVPIMAIIWRNGRTRPAAVEIGTQIELIVADLTKPALVLRNALKNCLLALRTSMENAGSTFAWGIVPIDATHLSSFLDNMVAAGKATKVDMSNLQRTGVLPEADSVFIYRADRDQARVWLEAQ